MEQGSAAEFTKQPKRLQSFLPMGPNKCQKISTATTTTSGAADEGERTIDDGRRPQEQSARNVTSTSSHTNDDDDDNDGRFQLQERLRSVVRDPLLGIPLVCKFHDSDPSE